VFVFGEWREIAEKGHEDLVSQLRSVSPYARHPAPHRAAQFRPSTTWRKLTASALRKALPTLPASKASGNSQYRVPRILGTVCMLHNPLPSLKNGHSLFFLHGNLSRFWLVARASLPTGVHAATDSDRNGKKFWLGHGSCAGSFSFRSWLFIPTL